MGSPTDSTSPPVTPFEASSRHLTSRLIEWFVVFNEWPTNRKTLLLCLLILPTQVTGSFLIHAMFARAGVVDVELVDQVFASGALGVLACLIVSWGAYLRGRDTRWPAYGVVILYGGFVVSMIHVMGTWSTTAIAAWPLVTLFVAIWYDTRMGWLALGYGLMLAVGTRILEVSGVLAYAPALLDRSIDAQQSAWWVAGNILLFGMFFVFCFALSMLVVAARRTLDLRLRDAHRRLDRSSQLIRRYVPSQLAERILRGDHTEALRPVRVGLTCSFPTWKVLPTRRIAWIPRSWKPSSMSICPP